MLHRLATEKLSCQAPPFPLQLLDDPLVLQLQFSRCVLSCRPRLRLFEVVIMEQVIRKYQDASRTWQQALDALLDRIGMHFDRKEMQERAKDYLHGLLRPRRA